MSQVAIFFIRCYQLLISPLLHTAFGGFSGCRYEISCSEYAVRSLQSLGIVHGAIASAKRIASCHP